MFLLDGRFFRKRPSLFARTPRDRAHIMRWGETVMDYYLFVARSVTHAQQMAGVLSGAGVSAKIRRAGSGVTGRGCGYTLEISRRNYARALDACRTGGVQPVRVILVSGDTRQEVTL